MTVDPKTPPAELVADLVHLLDLSDAGDDHFTGRRKKGGVGRVFGGQVIAQALCAAERTVGEDRAPHSLHAYFLRGGNEDHEIDFKVERDFDGGSFANRRVVASQQGVPILNLAASFQRAQDGPEHQAQPMPEVPGPDGLKSDGEARRDLAAIAPNRYRDRLLAPWPIEVRQVEPRHWIEKVKSAPLLHVWFRTVAALPDDPRVHRAVLAYASDMHLLGTATRPHGLSWYRNELKAASLDHAIWFHQPFRADEWLLHVTDSPWAGGARGFTRGQIYSADGRLVASTAQEGMLRPVERG